MDAIISSCLGGPGFKSWLEDRVIMIGTFHDFQEIGYNDWDIPCFFLSPSKQLLK